jgi:hypothetical protein
LRRRKFSVAELWLMNRVTRLGEFSPNGWLFTLGCFLKISEVAHIFGFLFSTVKVIYALILTKMYWATFLAILSTNSSGQNANESHKITKLSWIRTQFMSYCLKLRQQK